MLRKLLVFFAVLSILGVITCSFPNFQYPHYGVALAQNYSYEPAIEIAVQYFPGRANSTGDETEITIYGYNWDKHERIWVYINDMRSTVFDPHSQDWMTTVEMASIYGDCDIRVKGSMSGWSNYCDFFGADKGAVIGLIQPTVNAGVVGSKAGISSFDWYPRGLVTIYFRGLAVDRLYPSQVWQSEFTIPPAPAGVWPVVVKDESNSVTFNFEVIPSVAIDPADVSPGQIVTVIGTGFAANRYVHITPGDKVVFTNTDGSFRSERSIQIPSNDFTVQCLDEEDNSASLNVTPKVGPVEIPQSQPTTITIPPAVQPAYIWMGLAILAALIVGIAVIVKVARHLRR